MIQCKSGIRSLVGFNTPNRIFVNAARNCRLNYNNKLFFSSFSAYAAGTVPSLSLSKLTATKRVPVSSVGCAHVTDARLTEGVAQYRAQGWARVAEFMGDGLTAHQCVHRWNIYLEPQQRGLKRGNWQPNEEERLLKLVPQHRIPSYWSTQYKVMTQDRTDWTAIGRELGRVPQDCNSKYGRMQDSKMTKGPFTAEEDALICQRVEEWGDKGIGLWTALGREMGRPGTIIRARWHSQPAPNCSRPLYWTDEMDARLTDGVAQHKTDGWARVSEFMGNGLSAQQCHARWTKYLEPQQRGLEWGNWQPDEEERLMKLVPQHLIPSYGNTQRNATAHESADWKAIGKELGRTPNDCYLKYNLIQDSKMKKDPFTAEEDALLSQRVREWGDKGIGLWTALGGEMGRPGNEIYQRWLDLSAPNWTDEMDERLIQMVKQHNADGWARVAEFMGDGLSAEHCIDRWTKYLEPQLRELKTGKWLPEEVERLLELVPQHLYIDEGEECIRWSAIGKILNRSPLYCMHKYNRVIANSPAKRILWTDEMDARLTEGVAHYRAKGWKRVAEFMGNGPTDHQCKNRWNIYLGPLQKGLKKGNWQPDEEERLLELVPQHRIEPYWSDWINSMTLPHTDWKVIGEELGRVPSDCTVKYKLIQYSQMKKGPFTAEEDALICQRVEEWWDKGDWLWTALENEMNRGGSFIRRRWENYLSKKQ